jgi:hypothetical protein
MPKVPQGVAGFDQALSASHETGERQNLETGRREASLNRIDKAINLVEHLQAG